MEENEGGGQIEPPVFWIMAPYIEIQSVGGDKETIEKELKYPKLHPCGSSCKSKILSESVEIAFHLNILVVDIY